MVLENEPVRGGYPPPGFHQHISGAEQVRALVQGLVPRAPWFRLFGIRCTHAAPGSATLTMPASPWFQSSPGTQQVLPLVTTSLALAARTVAPAGSGLAGVHTSANYIRLASLDMESFVARARVIMAGPSRVTAETHVEDAAGRLVVYATAQFIIGTAAMQHSESVPQLERYEEPAYATPDPPFRPYEPVSGFSAFGSEYLDALQRSINRQARCPLPVLELMGGWITDIGEGTAECVLPASEWLANEYRNVNLALSPLLYSASSVASGSSVPEGRFAFGNVFDVVVFAQSGPPRADGGLLRARAKVLHTSERGILTDGEVFDQRDRLRMLGRTVYSIIDRREGGAVRPSERVLTTVLFADVVGSTPTAERMGDAKWQQLLQKNAAQIRNAVEAERGRQVKTEGDGFLATFDSPLRAVRCARAVRDAARNFDLQMRAGIHLGEVEMVGNDVAGIAVHVASRVESVAEPGTIFVTSTVREAMSGSGLDFSSRGLHQLKGVADEWHLFTVDD